MSSPVAPLLFPTSIAQTFHLVPAQPDPQYLHYCFLGVWCPHPFVVGFFRLAGVCLISAIDLQHRLVCVFAPCVVVSGKSLHHSLNYSTFECIVRSLPTAALNPAASPSRPARRIRDIALGLAALSNCQRLSYLRPRQARFDFVPLVIHYGPMLTHFK